MSTLPRWVVLEVFLRSFAIQGSWNYRTLQGSGFAFALMPALRHVHGHDPVRLQDAVARHTNLFNAHPYLSGVALGAVARMEADGEEPVLIGRFKTALHGSLGTLGDRIVWAGWRPACVLLALFVLLATQSAAAAIAVFLVVYNAAHVSLRWWGLRVGLGHGKRVAEALRQAPLLRWHSRVIGVAALLLGATLPLVVAGGLTESRLSPALMPIPVAAMLAGWYTGAAVRLPTLIVLVAAAAAGFLLRLGS
jgi:mannose/fructose/N-acetylgalactosamine-specific phosphotransferase system component IID